MADHSALMLETVFDTLCQDAHPPTRPLMPKLAAHHVHGRCYQDWSRHASGMPSRFNAAPNISASGAPVTTFACPRTQEALGLPLATLGSANVALACRIQGPAPSSPPPLRGGQLRIAPGLMRGLAADVPNDAHRCLVPHPRHIGLKLQVCVEIPLRAFDVSLRAVDNSLQGGNLIVLPQALVLQNILPPDGSRPRRGSRRSGDSRSRRSS